MSIGFDHRPDRRAFLVAAGAIAASCVAPIAPARGQGSATARSLKVGSIDISVISDGTFSQPTSVMLPGRPEAEIVALFERQGSHFRGLDAETNVVMIKTGGEVILVDAGAGPDFMPTLGRLAERLDAAGVKPEAVTKVIFTHAHADHFWGAVDPLGDGALFEKARHFMTAPERDFWLSADVEARVGEAFKSMAVGTHRRIKALAERIEVVKPQQEIAPGVALIDTAGHSPGHISVHVRSGGEQLVIGGDALIQSVVSFAAPEWRWGPDMDPDRAIATRRSLLDRLASEKIALLGYHLPWPGVGRVERKSNFYRFVLA